MMGITEGELLEIECRLRKLERDLAAAKPHLAFEKIALEDKRGEWTGESHYAGQQFEKWTRRIEQFDDLCADLESGIEAVRADTEKLMDIARTKI